MDKNIKIQQVYRVLLFTKDILGYMPKLDMLTAELEKLQPDVSAVETTVSLAENFRKDYPEVQDSEILELMHKEMVARLAKLDCNISCIQANIKQLEANIAQILEQALPNGQGCIGISQDTFDGENFDREYQYIFDNIKVEGNQIQPAMFFSSPSMCYRPLDFSISAESIPDNASKTDDESFATEEILAEPTPAKEEDFDDETVLDDKPSQSNASQLTGGNAALSDGLSSDFESSFGQI